MLDCRFIHITGCRFLLLFKYLTLQLYLLVMESPTHALWLAVLLSDPDISIPTPERVIGGKRSVLRSAFRCLRWKRSQIFPWGPALCEGHLHLESVLYVINTLHKIGHVTQEHLCRRQQRQWSNPPPLTAALKLPTRGHPCLRFPAMGKKGIPQIPWASTQNLCFQQRFRFLFQVNPFIFRFGC